jgi:hypothetical protein
VRLLASSADRLTDIGAVVGLKRQRRFTLQEDSWYSFLLEAKPTPELQEGLGKLKKKSNYLTGNRTSDLQSCRIVPQMDCAMACLNKSLEHPSKIKIPKDFLGRRRER